MQRILLRSTMDENDPFAPFWLEGTEITVGNQLGGGGFGTVYKGTYKDKKVAIKAYHTKIPYKKMSRPQKEDTLQEYKLMKGLTHPCVARVFGYSEFKGSLALVMELAIGTLKKLIEDKVFRLDTIWIQCHVLRQIAYGMQFIHREGILHRDLKPDNVLVFRWSELKEVKIADFGESRWVDPSRSLTEGKGTLTYMDPRACREHNDKFTDLFSFCSLASEVLTGKWLPRIEKIKTVLDTYENVRPPFPDNIPDRLKRVLLSGFEENVEKRASWEEIIGALCEAIEELYPDETNDDSSGFYGSSTNNAKKCSCPEIIAQEDCSFIDSLNTVFSNPANSVRHGNQWLKLVDILSLAEVLTGKWLPRIEKLKTVLDTHENVRLPFPDNIPDRLKSVLLSGFEENVEKRASWEEITGALCEAIEDFYSDETNDDSSEFYGSSANNTQSISVTKKCSCPEIIAQEDCSFIDSINTVFSNPANSLRHGNQWLKLVDILSLDRTSLDFDKKVEEAKAWIKSKLEDFYSLDFQKDLCNIPEILQFTNALVPLYLAQCCQCSKHLPILQELFAKTSNLLVKKLFHTGTDINFLFEHFQPSSYQKTRKLERKVNFQFVIDLIEDPLQRSTFGYSLVHFASLSGQLEILKSIVEQNPDQINAKNESHETPIMLAIVGGKVDVINFILTNQIYSRRLYIKMLNERGQTAMHYVPLASKNQVEIFKLLLPYFTDWNMADYHGTTPFMYMTWNGCMNIIEYIWTLQEKPDLFQENSNGDTALHFATFESFSEEANLQVLQFLFEKDANILIEKLVLWLWNALKCGKVQTTKFLLAQCSENEIKQLKLAIKEQNHAVAMKVMEEAHKLLKEEKARKRNTFTRFFIPIYQQLLTSISGKYSVLPNNRVAPAPIKKRVHWNFDH